MFDFVDRWITMAVLGAPLNYYSERRYRELTRLPQAVPEARLPSLSIIVPARNEAANLPRLLPSLATISYPGSWEVIVVDDNSTDKTAQIAEDYGTRVIQLDHLPEGWSGKTYACHHGALAAKGQWFLFTDADTAHHCQGPAWAVSYAVSHQIDGLSIFFKQNTSGVMDALALSVAFAGLFVSQTTENPTLNGQYILLRRDVYERSGGFSAVAGQSMEDLALAHHLRDLNYQMPLLRSDEVASVQMYRDSRSLWQGLTRIGAGSLEWMGIRSVSTVLFITALMSPILALLNALALGRHRKWALTSWLVVALSFAPWARRFGAGWLAILAPFGALIVQIAAVWGLIRRLFGLGTHWKGRKV
jgi:cellulose synthase/poly-beta-1,6-N-acetylglucosamine synthase-like glycosyltransferase